MRRNDIFDVFDNFFSDSFMPAAFKGVHPIKADIRETEKEFIVDAELPGVNKENIKLDFKNGILTIAVEHREETNEVSDKYIRRERKYGSFSRNFYVKGINDEAVTAKFENGVLSVILPKAENPKDNKHNIEIQ